MISDFRSRWMSDCWVTVNYARLMTAFRTGADHHAVQLHLAAPARGSVKTRYLPSIACSEAANRLIEQVLLVAQIRRKKSHLRWGRELYQPESW